MIKRKGKLVHLNVEDGDIKRLDCDIHDMFVKKPVWDFTEKELNQIVDILKRLLEKKDKFVFYEDKKDNDYDVIERRNGKLKELRIQFFHIK